MALNRGVLTNNVIAVTSELPQASSLLQTTRRFNVKYHLFMVHNTSGVTTAQSAIHYVANGESVGAGTSLFSN